MKISVRITLPLALLSLYVLLPRVLGQLKSGACPPDTSDCKETEPDQCKDDSECTGNQKCCYFKCGVKCMDPTTVKPGVCPSPGIVCDIDPLPSYCSSDSDCQDAKKCCSLSCSIDCADPGDPDLPFPVAPIG